MKSWNILQMNGISIDYNTFYIVILIQILYNLVLKETKDTSNGLIK